MSVWESESVEQAVLEALGSVHVVSPGGHHFGRPYITAYQLAIKVDAAHPNIGHALGYELGGSGTGKQQSLSQYLARQLSGKISQHLQNYPVEGAFISNEHLVDLTYRRADGARVVSSVTGSGFDLSMFRLRAQG